MYPPILQKTLWSWWASDVVHTWGVVHCKGTAVLKCWWATSNHYFHVCVCVLPQLVRVHAQAIQSMVKLHLLPSWHLVRGRKPWVDRPAVVCRSLPIDQIVSEKRSQGNNILCNISGLKQLPQRLVCATNKLLNSDKSTYTISLLPLLWISEWEQRHKLDHI